jgi:hypothetical protein
MTDAIKERYRRIRGAILKLLAHEHPGTIDVKVLHILLDDLGYTIAEEELYSHLVYLAEKDCVKVEKRESSGVKIQMAVITAEGLDVLDGFDPDKPTGGIDTRF